MPGDKASPNLSSCRKIFSKFIITYANFIYCFSKITNNVCIIGITHRLTEERYHSLWKLRWWGWNTYMLPTRYSWNLDWHCWASIVGRSRAMAVHLYLLAAHKHKTVAPQWRSKYSNQTKKEKSWWILKTTVTIHFSNSLVLSFKSITNILITRNFWNELAFKVFTTTHQQP